MTFFNTSTVYKLLQKHLHYFVYRKKQNKESLFCNRILFLYRTYAEVDFTDATLEYIFQSKKLNLMSYIPSELVQAISRNDIGLIVKLLMVRLFSLKSKTKMNYVKIESN